MKAYFIVNNELIGSGNLPREVAIRLGQLDRPHNAAYFCSACGEIWGRIVVSQQQDYLIRNRRCAQHGSGLFQDYSSPMWKHFPKEVLARELKLINQHYLNDPEQSFTDLLLNWRNYYE